jgi:hypothetical protein
VPTTGAGVTYTGPSISTTAASGLGNVIGINPAVVAPKGSTAAATATGSKTSLYTGTNTGTYVGTNTVVNAVGVTPWSATGRTLAATSAALAAAKITYSPAATAAGIVIVEGVREIISSRNGTNPLAPQALNLGTAVLSTLSAVNGELTNAAVTRKFPTYTVTPNAAGTEASVEVGVVTVPYTPVPTTTVNGNEVWAPAAYVPSTYLDTAGQPAVAGGIADSRQFYTTPSEEAPGGYDWNAHNAARAAGLIVE